MAGEFGVWETTSPAERALPRLEGPLDTEIAIIGAGYTGLSAALHLAELGLPAVVVEAHSPGWGASGRNTGWLEPNWWLKSPAQIDAIFGQDRGRALTRWVASGPSLLNRWSAKHDMSFEAVQRGLIMATEDLQKSRAIEAEARQWQDAGVPNEFLDRAAIRSHIASDRYCGAIWLRDGMTLNPLSLTRELARACVQSGVEIFARSAVERIDRESDGWRLTCAGGGLLRARRLLVATDAYTGDLWPQIPRAFSIWQCAVVASESYAPLRDLLLSGTPFADLNLANVFTLCEAPGGRLLTSTYAPLRGRLAPAKIAEPFMRKFRKVFPGRPEPRWQFAHSGSIAVTRDMLPRLCEIGPDAWTVFGYSGTGINLALLLGAELARLASGGDAEDSLFPVTQPQPMPLRHAISWGLRYLHAPLSRAVISRIA